MNHKETIEHFYASFANGDAQAMGKLYHRDIVFEDPAFGELSGPKPAKMWEMLLSRKGATPKITCKNVDADDKKGSAEWTAEYNYGPKKRKVVNHIQARFTFEDGKIVEHRDSFDLWKWSSQALGPAGVIMGWSPFMKKKIQKLANKQLENYIEKVSRG